MGARHSIFFTVDAMNLYRTFLSALFCVFFGLVSFQSTTVAQSSLVAMPGEVNQVADSENTTEEALFPGEPRNDLPAALQRTEVLLSENLPDQLYGEVTFRKLIDELRNAGISVTLDISAEDTISLSTDTEIPAPGASIDANLRLLLKRFDCTYVITNHGILEILSVDEAESELTHMTMDVTGLSSDVYELGIVVKNTIEPDMWEENGGTYRLDVYQANNRDFMTFAVTYGSLHAIRRYFSTINQMGGNSGHGIETKRFASSVVQMPMFHQRNVGLRQKAFVTSVIPVVDPDGRMRSSGGGFGGGIGGAGGFGGGGGIF